MSQPAGGGAGRYNMVGDYVVGKQIGAGSFSTVWHARHRVHGTEVAIKEIVTARLNSKLKESLKSEIFILKRINHPNIIHLHDLIEESGKIYIVLEFCKGGDLSMYIHRHQGRMLEATAKHFMHHLVKGLKVLRDYNLIHRDLKPQNLLLSTNDEHSVLKIADFGFARSLQPRGLAETLCGSPLYMAPEIMRLQKYDAKADLWSVGAILFQLVTGKTPFTGSNQMQLLQNIMKSTELQFPHGTKDLSEQCVDLCRKLLRSNPVERLTFEEFFNHPYLSQKKLDESFRSRRSKGLLAGFPSPERNTEIISQEEYLPFSIDGDFSSPDQNLSVSRKSTLKPLYRFSVDSKPNQREISNLPNNSDIVSKYSSVPRRTEISGSNVGSCRVSEGILKESLSLGSLDNHPKVMDSLESIDRDYVFVSGTSMDFPSLGASKPTQLPSKSDWMSFECGNMNSSASAPVPIISVATDRFSSQGSVEQGDILEMPSTHCITRIKSLKQCASAITDLVNEKIGRDKKLEAFSIQLVVLAIWKQALHACHTHAASTIGGSPNQETTRIEEISEMSDAKKCVDTRKSERPVDFSSQIEQAFVSELRLAEDLSQAAKLGNVEMPDAMELIYQSALTFGRLGAVDECLGDIDNAAVLYSKAVQLLVFLMVEAHLLILNPPFSLTNSDKYRIQSYIDVLSHRQGVSQSRKLTHLNSENQLRPSEIGDDT